MIERKMDLKKIIIIVVALVGFYAGDLHATGPVYNSANGHWYEAVPVTDVHYDQYGGPWYGLTWEDAKSRAESSSYLGLQGHLATITSQEENDFIINNLGGFDALVGFWLGGFQPEGSPEPAGNWQWITGEPWNYTNWAGSEPNNTYGGEWGGDLRGAPENILHFDPWNWNPGWNDMTHNSFQPGYIVEYDGSISSNPNPPVAEAGPDQIVEQTSAEGAEIVLDGSASTDDGLPEPLTYTWSWNGGSATGVDPTVTLPPGTTTVTLTVFDGLSHDIDTVNITVQDTTAPKVWCTEAVNPSGKNVPRSKNPDGFFQILASDLNSVEGIWVGTADNPMLFGPAWSGVYVKLTEAPGAEPYAKSIGNTSNVVIWHVTLPSDALVTAIDSVGNMATCKCLVPPPPK